MKLNNANRVNVVEVKCPPAIGKPEMFGGIRTKESAQVWGEKRGYATVYFWKERERVYADKLTQRVDVLAKQLETKSGRLLDLADHGQGLAEYVMVIAFVGFILFVICRNWPW